MEEERLCIMIIGGGGREHCLAWKLSQSPRVDHIYVVPGNGGTAHGLAKTENVGGVKQDDYPGLVALAKQRAVNLVVPGPEAPLVDGIEFYMRAAGLRCFGPSKAAARLEGSKAFSKDFMAKHQIPTAAYQNFSDYERAKRYLDQVDHRVVIKASGLAAGKGVILPKTIEEAHNALRQVMLAKEFGAAGDEVVIEEFLEGSELSFLTFSDGSTTRSLPPAQDHKQIFEGGPNTGGMGCYAPTRIASKHLIEQIQRTILQPTIDGIRRDRSPFVGLLFTGIIITKSGPKVLEYNCRFGDPETQTLLPLVKSDLAEVMIGCTDHWLDDIEIEIDAGFCATVVVSAGGYPGPYVRGDEITLRHHNNTSCLFFHAGTSIVDNVLKTSGGRVLAVTSTAASLEDAVEQAYGGVSAVNFEKMYYREDIAHRALNHQPEKEGRLTYADSGVSISAGNSLVEKIKPIVRSTARPGTQAQIGGFGGIFDLAAAGFDLSPTLVGAIDGIGTKLKVAHAMNTHDTIGIDLCAMNVNDLIVQGAEPLFFLDCFTCSRLDVDVAQAFVLGVTNGCKQAGCALLGGETAEMPGLFSDSEYDAVGAAIGAIPAGRQTLPDKQAMISGDVLLGLASSGVHSNGFSLVRNILKRKGLSFHDPAEWERSSAMSIGQSLLTPTKIYVKPIMKAVAKGLLKGMAHITGGGLIENIPRMLPKHLAAEISVKSWPMPAVMRWLKSTGQLDDMEFARTFNTGLGMVMVVSRENVAETMTELHNAGETVFEIGTLQDRHQEGCLLLDLKSWVT